LPDSPVSPTALVAFCLMASSLLAARPAGADEPPASRLFAGVGAGLNHDYLSVDGRPSLSEESGVDYGLELGYARDVVGRRLALTGIARFGTWTDGFSRDAGESRQKLDLRLAPELRLRLQPGRLSSDIGVSLGGGPSFAFAKGRRYRTVLEEYRPGVGLNGGGRFFASFFSQSGHGAYGALDLTFYALFITHHAEVLGDPSRSADSRYRYVGGELFARGGYVLSF
jgi:hypothetical protein